MGERRRGHLEVGVEGPAAAHDDEVREGLGLFEVQRDPGMSLDIFVVGDDQLELEGKAHGGRVGEIDRAHRLETHLVDVHLVQRHVVLVTVAELVGSQLEYSIL